MKTELYHCGEEQTGKLLEENGRENLLCSVQFLVQKKNMYKR